MPQLVASSGSLSGVGVCWKLQVTFHDRNGNPHRDFDTGDPNNSNTSPHLLVNPYVNSTTTTDTPDQVNIPAVDPNSNDPDNGWHVITDGTPWDISQEINTEANKNGFFGGDAILSLKIELCDGTVIMPQQDYKFRIAGENPDSGLCEQYISANNGGFWYMYAIARAETNGEGRPKGTGYYNNFLENGGQLSNKYKPWAGHEGRPNWNDDGVDAKVDPKTGRHVGRWTGTGGYGLLQLTYEAANSTSDTAEKNYIMPRGCIWNWQSNVAPAVAKLQGKQSGASKLYNWLIANYPSIQNCDGYPPGTSEPPFAVYDSILISLYNGHQGGSVIPPPPATNRRWSPWCPPSATNAPWTFTGTYVPKVYNVLNNSDK
jgi:hypothetical protein